MYDSSSDEHDEHCGNDEHWRNDEHWQNGEHCGNDEPFERCKAMHDKEKDLCLQLQNLECDTMKLNRPIRSARAPPVWDYLTLINRVKEEKTIFLAKYDDKTGIPQPQIGSSTAHVAISLAIAGFTDCRVFLITTTNNELVSETVDKLRTISSHTSFGHLLDIQTPRNLEFSVLRKKILNTDRKLLVLVDNNLVTGLQRLKSLVDKFEKMLGEHEIRPRLMNDEIDCMIRTKNSEDPKESEKARDELCLKIKLTNIYGCTATPWAVQNHFVDTLGSCYGFSDDWKDGEIYAKPDPTTYVALTDIKVHYKNWTPLFLDPVASTRKELQQARVGKYVCDIVSQMVKNSESAANVFFKDFLDDKRPNATMLLNLGDMVNDDRTQTNGMYYPSKNQLLTDVLNRVHRGEQRTPKIPTHKHFAVLLLRIAEEFGKYCEIITINGEDSQSKFQKTSTASRGHFDTIDAPCIGKVLEKCTGKVVAIFGGYSSRGRSFVCQDRVPTHLMMFMGKRSADLAIFQGFGRMCHCLGHLLQGIDPKVLCAKEDYQMISGLNDPKKHCFRKLFPTQSAVNTILDKYSLHDCNLTKLEVKMLECLLGDSSRHYFYVYSVVGRMMMLWEAVNMFYENGQLPFNQNLDQSLFEFIINHDVPTLWRLNSFKNILHKAWGVTKKGTRDLFVFRAMRQKTYETRSRKLYDIGFDHKQKNPIQHALIQAVRYLNEGPDSFVKTDNKKSVHSKLQYTESFRVFRRKVGTDKWNFLCKKIASRFLESDDKSTKHFIKLGKEIGKAPREYTVVIARDKQVQADQV